MKKILIEYEDMLGVLIISIIAIVGCVLLGIKGANEMKKRECYEIYATDNVILKKCEKYFEGGKE